MNRVTIYETYRATMTAHYGPGPWPSLPLHHRWPVWSRVYVEAREQVMAEARQRAAQKALQTKRERAS